MRKQRDPATGQFTGSVEKKTEKIWLRVPNEVYLQLIDVSEGDIPNFARQAILEKIERENQKAC